MVYVDAIQNLSTGKIVSIKGYGAAISQNVILTIFDGADNEISEITARTTGVGEFIVPWGIPSDLPPGTYLIKAIDAHLIEAETTFVIE